MPPAVFSSCTWPGRRVSCRTTEIGFREQRPSRPSHAELHHRCSVPAALPAVSVCQGAALLGPCASRSASCPSRPVDPSGAAGRRRPALEDPRDASSQPLPRASMTGMARPSVSRATLAIVTKPVGFSARSGHQKIVALKARHHPLPEACSVSNQRPGSRHGSWADDKRVFQAVYRSVSPHSTPSEQIKNNFVVGRDTKQYHCGFQGRR